MPDPSFALPKISIATPSFNQAEFLGESMDSVLGQNYPHLEYMVMDAGSRDGSVEVIKQREDRLAHWTSGPDGGHFAAINTAFARSTGDVMGWINSDDKLLPWTFSVIGEIFARFPEVEWLTSLFPLRWDAQGRASRCVKRSGFSRGAFLAGENLPAGPWRYEGWIQQESTFWRRSLWERAGASIDTRWPLAGDFELWARFHQHADLYAVDTPLGGFRLHGEQKSSIQRDRYLEESRQIFAQCGGKVPGRLSAMARSAALHAPASLRPALASQGLLHTSRLCLRNRANDAWELSSALH